MKISLIDFFYAKGVSVKSITVLGGTQKYYFFPEVEKEEKLKLGNIPSFSLFLKPSFQFTKDSMLTS